MLLHHFTREQLLMLNPRITPHIPTGLVRPASIAEPLAIHAAVCSA